MRWLKASAWMIAGLWSIELGCSSSSQRSNNSSPDAATASAAGESVDGGGSPTQCPSLFGDDILPAYNIEISSSEWAAVLNDFHNRGQNADAGVNIHPYHPIVFHYQNEAIADAMLRLRGTESWIVNEQDPNPKMQFDVAFDKVDPTHRFHGLTELQLPHNDDLSLLHERLAFSFLHDIGVTAQCANNAVVSVNGQFYGLFVNVEPPDATFLGRVYPGGGNGDLFKTLWIRETHKSSGDDTRINKLRAATDYPTVSSLVDVQEVVSDWAAEATMPHFDGFWGANHDYMVYDNPLSGSFVWLVHNPDPSFDYPIESLDPVYWWQQRPGIQPDPRFTAIIGDAGGLKQFVDAVRAAQMGYNVTILQGRVTAWAAQTDAAAQMEMRPKYAYPNYTYSVQHLHDGIPFRAAYIKAWLGCLDDPAHAGDDLATATKRCRNNQAGGTGQAPGSARDAGAP
jgi:hypothetical protein